MEIAFQPKALEDLEFWKKSGQKQIQAKITTLLLAIQSSPFEGIGKPEPLRHNFAGMWSRRINSEHRLIYDIKGTTIRVFSLKDHY
jgi:toxin YoeB